MKSAKSHNMAELQLVSEIQRMMLAISSMSMVANSVELLPRDETDIAELSVALCA